MGIGIHPTSKLIETRGFQCLGHSNWTICSSVSSESHGPLMIIAMIIEDKIARLD